MLPRFIDSALLKVRVDSAKSLIVDQTHLVLVSGKLVLQKSTVITATLTFSCDFGLLPGFRLRRRRRHLLGRNLRQRGLVLRPQCVGRVRVGRDRTPEPHLQRVAVSAAVEAEKMGCTSSTVCVRWIQPKAFYELCSSGRFKNYSR